MAKLSFHLLGKFEATSNGDELLHFPTLKAQAMLAYLLVEEAQQPGISHQRGMLTTFLWPDITPESAQANMRQTLYRLRQTLPLIEGENGENEHLLISDRLTIRVNPEVQYWLDVAEFERALNEADNGLEEERMASLLEASGYYRGDLLADISIPDSGNFENWAAQVREALRRKMFEALQQIGEKALAIEDWNQAQEAARRQIVLDDLNEAAYRQLMLALAMAGLRNEALTEFTALTLRLGDELGVKPMSETMRLATAIREGVHDREVNSAEIREGKSATDTAGRQAEIVLLDKVDRFWVKGVLQQSLQGMLPLALRMETMPSALATPWEMVVGQPQQSALPLPAGLPIDQVFNDGGQALLILGEPGAGKTTLLLELARVKINEARANSTAPLPVVLNLRSWADQHLPIAAWLVEELNIKYLIPLKIGRSWVKAGRLLLLLDGLDEVRAESQAACVNAINAFRQEYGLVPIAVSSRAGDYLESPAKLRLGEAIRLLPLDSGQVAGYLQERLGSRSGLINILERDSRLANLAQSPLMLNIIALTFRDVSADSAASLETAVFDRKQLLDTYVEHMIQRRGYRGVYTPEQIMQYLGWLAQTLIEQDQTVFLLEQMQPSWLRLDRSRWIYALTTRIVVSGILAIGYIIGFMEPALEEFSFAAVGATLLTSLLIGIVLGSVAAVRYRRQLMTEQGSVGRNDVWSLLTQLVVVGSLAFIVTIGVFLTFGFDLGHTAGAAYVNALIYALIFGVRGRRRSVGGDIRPVETFIWSWRGMLTGCIPGLLVGAALGILDQYVTGDTQQNSVIILFAILSAMIAGLVGGLRRGAVDGQDRPNNGIYLNLRYGIRVGLIISLVAGVTFMVIFGLDPVNAAYRWIGLQFAIRMGLGLGLLALLWYGGVEVLHHAVLRTLLRLEGSIPSRYTAFLDHAIDLIFLRRVGGGYIFVHQLLHDYFAGFE